MNQEFTVGAPLLRPIGTSIEKLRVGELEIVDFTIREEQGTKFLYRYLGSEAPSPSVIVTIEVEDSRGRERIVSYPLEPITAPAKNMLWFRFQPEDWFDESEDHHAVVTIE